VIRSNAAFPVPDVTFVLLPSSADVLMRRIARRGKAEEAFERSGFLTRAIEVYRHLPDYFPNEKFVFLDADLPTEQNLSLIEPHLS
jgi:thymidylate kinase